VDPQTGATHPYFVIENICPALIEEGAVCSLYPDWPYTCATYPFLLSPDNNILVHDGCPGFGKGDVVDHDEMRKKIIRERIRAGMIVEED
jgi:Fe-S-cluster containining protein